MVDPKNPTDNTESGSVPPNKEADDFYKSGSGDQKKETPPANPDEKPKGDATPNPTEPKKAEDPKADDKPKDENAPLKKEDLKIPDGSLLEQSAIDDVLAYAVENKLSKEQAQILVERESNAVASYADRAKAKMDDLSKNVWMTELKNDKEIGGDKLGETAEVARRVVDKFFQPEFKKLLEDTGYGNYPPLVRGLLKIGRAMQDDKIVTPGAHPAGDEKPVEELFYPSSK